MLAITRLSFGMAFKVQPYFRYPSLDLSPPSIRLCRLLPGLPADRIKCELFATSIAAASGTYAALSYTWGSTREARRWIHVDGIPFHAQPNLFDALKGLRNSENELVIWIDAICIDQNNVPERNYQVALMGDIFRNASVVRVWLGPGSDETDKVLDYVCSLVPGSLAVSAKTVFYSLCKHRYWNRAWIRQELCLAKDIIVHCGTRSCDWATFSSEALQAVGRIEGCFDDSTLMLLVHRDGFDPPSRQPLVTLLSRYCQTAECYDIRDRVFSVLSLATEFEGREHEIIDYKLSVEQLFIALVAFCETEEPGKFSSYLQDTLQVRFSDLIPVWNALVEQVTGNGPASYNLSIPERKTIQYVRRLWTSPEPIDFMTAPSSGTSSLHMSLAYVTLPRLFRTPETNQIVEQKLQNQHLWFYVVGNSDYALRFTPSIFGPVLQDFVCKSSDDKWSTFEPEPFTQKEDDESVWTRSGYLVPPSRVLGAALPKEMVVLQKNDQRMLFSPECLDLEPDMVVRVLAELNRERGDLCLLACRSLIEWYYGYCLAGPYNADGSTKPGLSLPSSQADGLMKLLSVKDAYDASSKHGSIPWRTLIQEKEIIKKQVATLQGKK